MFIYLFFYFYVDSTGGAFAIIYPTQRIICLENLNNNHFSLIVKEAINQIDNNKNKNDNDDENDNENININMKNKKDLSDLDSNSLKWNHEYITGRKKIRNDKNDDDNDNDIKSIDENGVKIILYGVIGSSSFCKLHQSISKKTEEMYVRYAVRHAHPGIERTTNASTYIRNIVCLQ